MTAETRYPMIPLKTRSLSVKRKIRLQSVIQSSTEILSPVAITLSLGEVFLIVLSHAAVAAREIDLYKKKTIPVGYQLT